MNEAIAESIVALYLASQGMFLSPQYAIRDDAGAWSCPDFVALDFPHEELLVVEVSVSSGIGALIRKIRDRENQWFSRLRAQLEAPRVPCKSWPVAVLALVRADQCDRLTRAFQNASDDRVKAIEDIAFVWKWPWDDLK